MIIIIIILAHISNCYISQLFVQPEPLPFWIKEYNYTWGYRYDTVHFCIPFHLTMYSWVPQTPLTGGCIEGKQLPILN